MSFLKNAAVTGFSLGLISKTDGSDISTGTPIGYYILDGGAQTAIADVTPVHEGNGQWTFDLLAAEMNGDIVGLSFTHGSAITVHFTIKTVTKLTSTLNDPSVASIQAGLATEVKQDIIDTNVDVTLSRLPSSLVGGKIDANIGSIASNVSAAINLGLSAGQIIPFTVDTATFSPTTTVFEADNITEATADHYNGRVILWTSGTLLGQATSISEYILANGKGKFTVIGLTEAPANNDTGVIV